MINQMLLLLSTLELPRRAHSRQNCFTVMYQIHIQVLMMGIYEIDIVAKSSRGEVRKYKNVLQSTLLTYSCVYHNALLLWFSLFQSKEVTVSRRLRIGATTAIISGLH